MRLLIHGINYAPELAGIGRYTGELGAWLAARGHRVTVLTAHPYYPEWRVHPAYRGRGWRREFRDGVEVLRAPLYVPIRVTGKTRFLHEISFGASCLYWWPYLCRQRWDAVLAVYPPLHSGIIPSWLVRHQKIPLIIHVQDLQVDAARELGIFQQRLILTFLEGLERLLLRRAEAVTTISLGMRARLLDKGVPASHLHLFPNWADLERISPSPKDNPVRRQLGLKPEEMMVLYAGSLGEKHGLEVILESARLTQKESSIRYVVAGEGVAKSRLIELARLQRLNKVLFLPLQSEALFPLLLAAGDIHLVVQKRKAADLVMPSKLTNIMAAGRPFIATALPGTELARVTVESQAGLLVPPENAHELAKAILKLAAEETTRQEMGRRARAYAEAQLDRETVLTRFEDLVFRLTDPGRSSARSTSGRFAAGPPPG